MLSAPRKSPCMPATTPVGSNESVSGGLAEAAAGTSNAMPRVTSNKRGVIDRFKVGLLPHADTRSKGTPTGRRG